MTPTISIVTPTYNQAQFVAQTIESILSQKGNFYIDYIIINDGSTDNTQAVIKKYDALIRNKTWPVACLGISYRAISRENKGQTRTINEGFDLARGELLAWMNSDDYYMPGAFQTLTETYEKHPDADLFYGETLKIYEDGSRPNTIEPKARQDEDFRSLSTRGNSFALNFFTRRIIDKVGPPDVSYKYCMDLELWFRILASGHSAYIPCTVGAFRLWSGSSTTTKQQLFDEERDRIARTYGGNIVRPKTIYRLRKRFAHALNFFQVKTPHLYATLKALFYRTVDLFKYKKEKAVQ